MLKTISVQIYTKSSLHRSCFSVTITKFSRNLFYKTPPGNCPTVTVFSTLIKLYCETAQDQIRWKLRIWSHLLKKSLTENIVFVQRFWLVLFRKMNSNFESQEWRVKRIVLLYCSKEYKISFEKEKYIVAGVENLIEHKLGVMTGRIVKYNKRLLIFQNSSTLIRLSHRAIVQ